MRDATIADYRWLYAHGYMPDGVKCAEAIIYDIVKRCPGTFLDYGCGRGHLVEFINHKTRGFAFGYDPASSVAMTSDPLSSTIRVDWVISCDVLEHLSSDDLDAALKGMNRHAAKGLLLTIANMSDVHNVNGEEVQLHLIREDMTWWTERLREHFPTSTIRGRPIGCGADRFAITVDFP